MREIFKSKSFIFGCVIGFFSVWLWGFVYAFLYPRPMCFDCYVESGFPFTSHKWGTISHLDETIWIGAIGNVLVFVIFCLSIGFLFNLISTKVLSK